MAAYSQLIRACSWARWPLCCSAGQPGGVDQETSTTGLLEVEKTRRQAEARYQTMLLSIGDGVIVTDLEGSVILLNPVAVALTGWSQGEARGKPLEEIFRIINEETRQPVENQLRRVGREGTISRTGQPHPADRRRRLLHPHRRQRRACP